MKLLVNEIYRILYQRELYLLAYGKLYRNDGAMTKGATTETVDGMSMAKIENLIELLRFERYRWTPMRCYLYQQKECDVATPRLTLLTVISCYKK